ncbi:MAG TPA: hypothetical protein DIV79_16360 [Opitutae bacterium]|nr:hypothetical protein [Opitutaceae bacterium]HCR31578.1 hypothetical protein [Opitutae bacterium]|tara:strand:+ start:96 stop:1058 length:963 start_codon:yes stop_codon:yes gene_type:complete
MFSVDFKSALILLIIGLFNPVFSADPTVKNVIYGMDHGSALLMDVYQPETANGAGVVFIMGTGFTAYGEYDDVPLKELDLWLLDNGVFSDLYGETRQAYIPLIESGFTVFSINHRLGPKHHFQSQIADCQRAVQFVRHHAAKYGIQPNWIASVGHSSGATMASLLGVLDDMADPAALDPVSQQSSRVQAAIAAAGVHDLLRAMESNPSNAPMLLSFTGKAITYQPPGHPIFQAYEQASTVSHIDAADPPFFLIHGDDDPAVDISQSRILQASLSMAGIPNRLLILPGTNHAELGEAIDPLPFDQAATWLIEHFHHSTHSP